MVVASPIVTDAHVPPEVIKAEGAKHHVGVIELVVMANPRADESPGGLNCGVGSETGDFSWFTS